MRSGKWFCLCTAVILTAVGAAGTASAQESGALPAKSDIGKRWRLVGDNGFAVVYLDSSRVSRIDASRADVWLYLELYSRSPSPGGWFDRTVDHVRVNCSDLVVEGLYSTSWYDHDTFIKTMGTGVLQSLPPSTNTKPMAERVCSLLKL